mgnify:CR=1 FL=1
MKRLSRCLAGALCWVMVLPATADEVAARVAWSQRVELGPLVSGVIREVHVQAGDRVADADDVDDHRLVELGDQVVDGRHGGRAG